MIRVLIISPTSEWGGPEESLLQIVRNVDREQFALSAVFPAPGPYTAQFEEAGVPIHIAPLAPIEKSILSWKLAFFGLEMLAGTLRVARIARHWKADLLYTNCSASLVGPLAA